MSEIKTIEHYIVDRLDTLEADNITLKAERDFYRQCAKEVEAKLREVANLIEITRYGDDSLRYVRVSAFESFEKEKFEMLKSIKEDYGVRNHNTAAASNEEK